MLTIQYNPSTLGDTLFLRTNQMEEHVFYLLCSGLHIMHAYTVYEYMDVLYVGFLIQRLLYKQSIAVV